MRRRLPAPTGTACDAAGGGASAGSPKAGDAALAPPAEGTAPAPKPAVPPKPPSRILVAITPWGEVLVDGRRRGLAPPLSEIRVPPGKHTIEVRNSTFPPHTQTVDVPVGGDVRIKHKFQ